MNFKDLPVEIHSRICRFLGLDETRFIYKNKDFKALRQTYRGIRERTQFDAAIRYGLDLRELEIVLNHKSLCRLLHIVKIKEFRHKIDVIFFYGCGLTALPPDSNDAEKYRQYLEDEERNSYIDSSEAVYLLVEIFRYLADAKRLQTLELNFDYAHHLLLAALDMAKFPKQLLDINVEFSRLLNRRYGELRRSPSIYAPYIKFVNTEYGGTPAVGKPGYASNVEFASDLDELATALIENEAGYHVRNYRLNYPQITKFFLGLNNVQRIFLEGCAESPRLRFCNACNDMFVHGIIEVRFTQPTMIEIQNMYISGGRLRRFIRQQAHTLQTVLFRRTTLTDGSWKSVARCVLKASGLNDLAFHDPLCQKWGENPSEIRPDTIEIVDSVYISVASNTEMYLKAFIKYFSTSLYVPSHLPHRIPPKYSKVDIISISCLPGWKKHQFEEDGPEDAQAIKDYALQIEGK
ncbi:hypothetical protein G6011_01902 [Alternaria panax]|uniref:Uncharacterized protein n=1 Tax=Alternaria panax TaxID=48097 RepID=A0AAD4I965_9PLEO|nr:hypothetical protein G6011_01902 [Alternaria panax]